MLREGKLHTGYMLKVNHGAKAQEYSSFFRLC
jgi:hypothetical protein